MIPFGKRFLVVSLWFHVVFLLYLCGILAVPCGKKTLPFRGSGDDPGNCCQRPLAEDNSFTGLLHY
jgi:hypothetical protein